MKDTDDLQGVVRDVLDLPRAYDTGSGGFMAVPDRETPSERLAAALDRLTMTLTTLGSARWRDNEKASDASDPTTTSEADASIAWSKGQEVGRRRITLAQKAKLGRSS